MTIHKEPLVPDRVRTIDGGFSFIPHRFLTDGFLAGLSADEILVYFLLVLAGDRQGLSYYSQDRLCTLLRMSPDRFLAARNGLIDKSLLAFDGFLFQVLSLPEKPVNTPCHLLTCPDDFEQSDPMTIRSLINQSFLQEADHDR